MEGETQNLPHLKMFEIFGTCIIYLIILSPPLSPTQLNIVVKVIEFFVGISGLEQKGACFTVRSKEIRPILQVFSCFS